MRNVRNLSHLLKKIATTQVINHVELPKLDNALSSCTAGTFQALVRDWKALKKSMHSLLTVGELACNEREGGLAILGNLRDSVTNELHDTAEYLARIFDAEGSVAKGRFCVNPGVDEELDRKRRVHNGLADLLEKVRNRC